jgi:arylsulfatase A-like enzyme
MNSLQKLIEVEGYESFVTIDPVVRIVTKPSQDVTELDRGYLWFKYDFCRTLGELQTKIEERQNPARPMFVFTEPQNVHRMVLQDNGERVPPGERYPGFFAPYASQVKYMDECFGAFIEHLKTKGLYDNSIIILTSDHGDSLGEEGRWGHSYWLFPEILRVPLIIHLPPAMLKGMVWNPKSVAFNTDITPTLYYLLGHRPIERNGIFGRPLITSTKEEQTEYLQKHHLVVSSYGPVYGVLGRDARSLFIADAVNRKDYFFNLADDPKGSRNRLTPANQAENQKLVRDLVVSVNQFYGLGEYP